MGQLEFISLFLTPLEQNNIKYMVTGSFASMAYSDPRLTLDVDMVLILKEEQLELIQELFPSKDYYTPGIDILKVELKRSSHAHFNLIHHKSGLKADCYPNTGDEFELWALENRIKIEIDADNIYHIAPVEYVIIKKFLYFIEGRSEKHIRDIKGMLNNQSEKIDKNLMKKWLDYYSQKDNWGIFFDFKLD